MVSKGVASTFAAEHHSQGCSRDDLCKAEVELRRQVVEMADLLKQHVAGFEDSYLVSSAVVAGVEVPLYGTAARR